MDGKIIESMLHPIRSRIIQELLRKGTATTKEIGEVCPEITHATLYRHMNKLLNENIIEVVSENKVRGIIEKVYSFKNNPYAELEEITKSGTPQQMLNLFYSYTKTLLDHAQAYLTKENVDPREDGMCFFSYNISAQGEEFDKLIAQIKSILDKKASESSNSQVTHKISIVGMPVDET